MSKKSRILDFRFSVGSIDGPRSSVWRVWNHRSDIYVTQRAMGRISKISIHEKPEPNCNYGITREFAQTHLGGVRKLQRWRRGLLPLAGQGRAVRVVWLAFPTDYLGQADIGDEVHWIPAAPKRTATQIDMIFTLEDRSVLETAFLKNGRRLEKYVVLPNGEAFAIVSSTMPDWENRDLWLRGGVDFANVGFRAGDERGANRSEVICLLSNPTDGDAIHVQELWGNQLKGGEFFAPNFQTLTGGPGGFSSATHS